MKIKLILSTVLSALFLFTIPETGLAQTQTAAIYNVKTGVGNGIRLWNNDNFKIHMGNTSSYRYGPVSDFSIKMTMNNNANRGWTWGKLNTAPVAALNTEGKLQVKGWIRSMNRIYYFGNSQRLYGDNYSALHWRSAVSNTTNMIFQDKEGKKYGQIYGSGNGKRFGLLDANGDWTYVAVLNEYTAFQINNVERMRIRKNGNVGIGTSNPTNKLDVNGVIRAKEVRVETGWSDHVFLPEYEMPSLQEEEAFIKQNGHLLGFESEKAMGGEVKLADITNRQQETIEKLMLHVIELKKEIEALKTSVNDKQ